MKEFKERVRLPCDDKKIRSSHEDHLLKALTFFESETTSTNDDETKDTTVAARWLYMEELAVDHISIFSTAFRCSTYALCMHTD